jgi:hypothetical protein
VTFRQKFRMRRNSFPGRVAFSSYFEQEALFFCYENDISSTSKIYVGNR